MKTSSIADVAVTVTTYVRDRVVNNCGLAKSRRRDEERASCEAHPCGAGSKRITYCIRLLQGAGIELHILEQFDFIDAASSRCCIDTIASTK